MNKWSIRKSLGGALAKLVATRNIENIVRARSSRLLLVLIIAGLASCGQLGSPNYEGVYSGTLSNGTYQGRAINESFSLDITFRQSTEPGKYDTTFMLNGGVAPFQCGKLSGNRLNCVWVAYINSDVYSWTLVGQFDQTSYFGTWELRVSDLDGAATGTFRTTQMSK